MKVGHSVERIRKALGQRPRARRVLRLVLAWLSLLILAWIPQARSADRRDAVDGEVRPAAAAEPASQRGDTVLFSVACDRWQADPGDTLNVELTIGEAGPLFNAYDAYVTFDSSELTFLEASDLRDQEGPLMREACPQTFHLFHVDEDSAYVVVNHSLLCPGVSLSGPGVVYRLQFICRQVDADTRIGLARAVPTATRFFLDGGLVTPLATVDAVVRIGEGSSPVPSPLRTLELNAAPNPFNAGTILDFTLSEPAPVVLAIYALDGRHVKELLQTSLPDGRHRVSWPGCDAWGQPVAAGVYLVRLQVGARTAVRRVTVIK